MRVSTTLACAMVVIGCGGSTAEGESTTDAGLSRADAPAEAGGACCLDAEVAWGLDGGFVAYVDSSALSGCGTYTHERKPAELPTEPMSCTDAISACGVVAALADADVVAAFAAVGPGATAIYGSDWRGCDGGLFRVTIGDRSVDLGGDCAEAGRCGPQPTCVPVPPGLDALRTTLRTLDAERLATGACAGLFR